MAITRVQTAKGGTIGGSTVAATWGANTTAGNLLVGCVFCTPNGTITPPSGWTSLTALNASSTIQIFFKVNAAAQSATGNFGYGPGAANLIVAEYSGCDTSTPFDKQATNNGSSTSADSGTTATTTNANEVAVAFLANTNSATYSNPTNSFGLVTNNTSGSLLQMLDKVVSATGTQDCGATQSANAAWWGAIATFSQQAASSFSATGSGNAVFKNASSALLSVPMAPSGVMTLGGTDTVVPRYIYTLPAGNAVLAGAGSFGLSFSTSPTGVVSLGGSAPATIIVYASAGGEVVVEGSAFYVPTIVYSASGGMNLGNTSDISFRLPYGASGVLLLGASAGVSGLLVVQADGGLLLAGAGAVSFVLPYVPSGVLLLAGAAGANLHINVVCLVAGTKAERQLQGGRQAQQRLRAGRKAERQITGLRGICPGTAQ